MSAETRRKAGERYSTTCSRVLNNFFLCFPVGNYPYKTGGQAQGYYRTLSREHGWWDVTYISAFPNTGESEYLMSHKRLHQTCAEFYREIDSTVEELGIPLARVSEVINRVIYIDDDGDEKAEDQRWKSLWEVLRPIYITLRKKGYTQQDLKG